LHQNEIQILSDPYIHEGLELLKDLNLIDKSGASVYSFNECEYCINSEIFDCIQIPLNITDTSFFTNFIKNTNSSKLFVARSLLLQGILVNRDLIKTSIRSAEDIFVYLNKIDSVAKKADLSVLELCLAFIFSLPDIDHYIIGSTSINNLLHNIKCMGIILEPDIIDSIFELSEIKKNWSNPRNW
jgi:aryl-alcohol dehydrogenase-like predicted oxidoreductase